MLEDLLKAKKISHEEYVMYVMFESSPMGKGYFDRMFTETYMEEVPLPGMSGATLAYAEGKRSIFREIFTAIKKINKLLEDTNYDGPSDKSRLHPI